MLNGLINNYAQKKKQESITILVSHRYPEIHAEEIGNLEQHEVLKIEDRVQCQI